MTSLMKDTKICGGVAASGGLTQLLTIYSIVAKTNATDGNTSSTSLQITPASTSAAFVHFCIFLNLVLLWQDVALFYIRVCIKVHFADLKG